MADNQVFTLEQLRLINHCTMEDIAKFLGIHAQTYAQIEKNPDRANIQQAKMLSKYFKKPADELDLKYLATHKFDDLGNDFFTTLPPKQTDLMISNPPFSIQNDIIKRSFWLVENGYIKSFVLLLPLATLETPSRAEIYSRYADKLAVIIFKKRIKFIGHNNVFNKGCCWIYYKIKALDNKRLSWL